MSDKPYTPHDYAGSRRYICTSCDAVVRARWDQSGSGYPGSFHVGCECTIVPVVPQMSQAETPESWRVERPECCRGVDVAELEEYNFGVCDYACPDCGATYRWDGTMSTAPESEEQPDPPDDQQLLTDGGRAEDVERDHQCPTHPEAEVSYSKYCDGHPTISATWSDAHCSVCGRLLHRVRVA